MNLLRCKPAKTVFVALPSYTASVRTDTCMSLVDAIPRLILTEDIQVAVKPMEGNCYIDYVRNELVADFEESEATDLVFIDDDVGFHYETFLKLCKANRPVLGAIYPKKTDDESWPVDFLEGWHAKDSDGLIEVKMIPTGMMRINRAAFDALKPHVRKYKGRTREVYAYFKTDIRDTYYGEDIEFCRIWREIGGKVWCFPDETLSHTGPKAWIGNLGESMRDGKLK